MTTKTKAMPRTKRTVPKPHERQKGYVTDPIKTLQLIDAMGVSRASRHLGVSTTTLHKARKPGAKVSRVIEVGAAGVLREIAQPEHLHANARVSEDHATRAFLMEVDSGQAALVAEFAKMIHGKLIAA
jgi:hypothetical protein